MLALLSVAGPISRFLQSADTASSLLDLSAVTSLLAIVVFIAFVAGVAYGAVAIPAQTQLQEDLPEDVRGRVFGVLNMLVSVSSFLPIIIVGPISDLIGTATVMLVVGDRRARVRRRERVPARPEPGRRRGERGPALRGPARGGPGRRPADVARGRRRRPAACRRPAVLDAACPDAAGRRIGPSDPPTATDARRPMARVAVVFTGGTISMGFDPVGRRQRPGARRGGDPGPDAGARADRRRRPDRPRADAGQPLHVRRRARDRRRVRDGARRPRRSTAWSSSRARTRSRRRASPGTSSCARRSRSS